MVMMTPMLHVTAVRLFMQGNSDELVQLLATTLDMPISAVKSVLTDQRYILTLDFLLKLLYIHEKRTAVVPTIWMGETGVGKTRLLRVYAALLAKKYVMCMCPVILSNVTRGPEIGIGFDTNISCCCDATWCCRSGLDQAWPHDPPLRRCVGGPSWTVECSHRS